MPQSNLFLKTAYQNFLHFKSNSFYTLSLIIILSNFLSQHGFSQPEIIWNKVYGDTVFNFPCSIIEASNGDLVSIATIASTNDDVSSSFGEFDYWVFRMSSEGELIWEKSFGGSLNDIPSDLIETSDGGLLVVGSSSSVDGDVTFNNGNSDFWVIKLNSEGELIWEKSFGGSDIDYADSVVQTQDGGFVVLGISKSVDGDVSFNNGDYDYWIIRLNQTGDLIWEKSFGSPTEDGDSFFVPDEMIVDNDGNYVIAGTNGGPDGDVSLNNGGSDAWIFKINDQGEILWEKSFGGLLNDYASSIVQDDQNGYIVLGRSETGNGSIPANNLNGKVWIFKLNNQGDILWEKNYGGSSLDAGNSIIHTSNGESIITGVFSSPDCDISLTNATSILFLIKLDNQGDLIWKSCYGGIDEDGGLDLIQTSDSNLVISGYTDSQDGDVNNVNGIPYGAWILKLGNEIPTLNINSPKLNLSTATMQSGDSLVITGSSFAPNSLASITISGPNLFSEEYDNVLVNNNGNFTLNFHASESILPGIYNVSAKDNESNLSSNSRSFIVEDNSTVESDLKIIDPLESIEFEGGKVGFIEWIDRMNLGGSYPVNGAKRLYSYTIEHSENGGLWEAMDTIEGSEFIDELIYDRHIFTVNSNNASFKIRIVDNYNPANVVESPVLYASPVSSTNIQVNLKWDHSFPVPDIAPVGVASDGVGRIFLELSKIENTGPAIQSVSIELHDNNVNSSYKLLGKIGVANTIDEYSIEANNLTTTNTNINEPKEKYYFWYVAPDDFVGNHITDVVSADRSVFASFSIEYEDGVIETFEKEIEIVRPPLALVHGLGGSPKSWDKFRNNSSLFKSDPRFTTVKTIQLEKSASFDANSQLLVFGIEPFGSPKFEKSTIQGVIMDIRKKGFAANRVDYVAHSMGGCVLRNALTQFPDFFYGTGIAANRPYKTYGMGYTNKVITIGTPHLGSYWADFLERYEDNFSLPIRIAFYDDYRRNPNHIWFSFYQIDTESSLLNPKIKITNAVKNLKTNGGVTFNSADLNAHLISGDAIPGTQFFSEPIFPTEFVDLIEENREDFKIVNYLLRTAKLIENDNFIIEKIDDLIKNKTNADKILGSLLLFMEIVNITAILPESDLVVTIESQLSGLPKSAPNVNATFDDYVFHSFFRQQTQHLGIGNWVMELLNTPIESDLFGPIPETGDMSPMQNVVEDVLPPLTTTPSIVDHTKLEILDVSTNDSMIVDSSFVLRIHMKDTTNLLGTEVYFQNSIYELNSFLGISELQLQVSPGELENERIIVNSIYDYPDSSLMVYDTSNVYIVPTENLQSFKADSDILYIFSGTIEHPKYQAVFETYITPLNSFSDSINAFVADTSIVSFEPLTKGFFGKSVGETYAIVSYKGISDTLYIVVEPPVNKKVIVVNAMNTGIICSGDQFSLPFSIFGEFENDEVFTAELSDQNGSFSDPIEIGTSEAPGNMNVTIPSNILTGSKYRIRIVSSSNSISILDNGIDLSIVSTPDATISVIGSLEFCQGDSVQLNLENNTAFSYEWLLDGTLIEENSFSISVYEAGEYMAIISNENCSDTSSVAIDVLSESTNYLTEVICEGETYNLGSSSYNTSGVYNELLTTAFGCDSLVVLDLTVVESFENDTSAIICQGETFQLGNSAYSTAGVHIENLLSEGGCDSTIILYLQINESPVLQDSFIVSADCGQLGSIYLTTQNASNQFTWSNGDQGSEISVGEGQYTVTITNDFGCTIEQTFEVEGTDAISLDFTTLDISCYGANDGAISTNLTGGAPPYTYIWTPGNNQPNISDLGPGQYTLSVFDCCGCAASEIVEIIEPNPISINLDINLDGLVSVNPTGGTSPYQVLWSNGSTEFSVSDLGLGKHSVTITDSNGCEEVSFFTDSKQIQSLTALKIFPNPAQNTLFINASFSSKQKGSVQLFNVLGQSVKEYIIDDRVISLNMDVSGLGNGMYLLNILTEEGQVSEKVIIKR